MSDQMMSRTQCITACRL